MKSIKKDLLFAVGIYILLSFFLFIPAIFQSKSIYFGDNYYLIYPQRKFFFDSIKSGTIPFWNPYVFGGVPFFADINHSSFYPLSILSLLFDPLLSLNVSVFIHLVISAIGVFATSRLLKQAPSLSYLSGLVWLLSETVLSVASFNLAILQSITWLPWIIFILLASSSNKVWLYFLPILFSLSFLGGHPQLLIYLIFVTGIYFLFTREYRRLTSIVVSVGVFLFLNIAILIPFGELGILSTRSIQPWSDKVAGSVKTSELIQWVIPNFFSDPGNGIFWGPSWDKTRTITGYVSLAGLFGYMLLVTRKKSIEEKYLLFLGGSSLILSLGNTIPLIWDVIGNIPGINSFRNPSAFVGLWTLSASILMGTSVAELKTYTRSHSRNTTGITLFWFMILGLFFFSRVFNRELWLQVDNFIGNRLSSGGFHTYERDLLILQSISKNLLISFSSFLAIIFILKSKKKCAVVLFLVIGVDLFLSNRFALRFANREIYAEDSSQSEWLKHNLDKQYRIISSSSYFPYTGIQDYWNNVLFLPPFSPAISDDLSTKSLDSLKKRADNLGANWNMVYSIPLLNGYGAFVLRDVAEYWKTNQNYIPINDVDKVPLDDFRLSDQGVKYITFDTSLLNPNTIPFNQNNFAMVYQNKQSIILENLSVLPIVRFVNQNNRDIFINHSNVNQMSIDYNIPEQDILLIKTTYYPGWKCFIDDKKLCVISKDNSTIQVSVPQGNHRVVLDFSPTGWPYVLYLSILSYGLYFIVLYREICVTKKLIK